MSTNTLAADPKRLSKPPEFRTFRGIRIATVQKLLRELGYDTKDANGVLGHETQNAILWFQCKNATRVDGKLNSQLVTLMQKKRDDLEAATR